MCAIYKKTQHFSFPMSNNTIIFEEAMFSRIHQLASRTHRPIMKQENHCYNDTHSFTKIASMNQTCTAMVDFK